MKKNIRDISHDLLFRIIHEGAYPDIVLRHYFTDSQIDDRERNLITEIIYGVLRWKLKLNHIISLHVKKRQRNKSVNLILLISIYQILYLESVPDYAAVDEGVKIAKKKFGIKISRFVNAVLREIIRNKSKYINIDLTNDIDSISVNYSFPRWLIEYWFEYYTENEIMNMCNSLNQKPLNTLRVNNLVISRDGLINLLNGKDDIRPTRFSDYGVNISSDSDLNYHDLYKKGLISFQDEASQLMAIILDPRPNDIILDVCSAPGTKSTHIAQILDNKCEIISCDLNHSRLKLVDQDCKRLGVKCIHTICADCTNIHNTINLKFDRILVDAPCSGLGTIRKNPDLKWNRSMSDIHKLSILQYDLLDSASKLLKTGGILLYSVCTISYFENEHIAIKFINNHPDYEIDKEVKYDNNEINRLFSRKGYFTSFKNLDTMDGFFAVKFRKTKDKP